MKTDEPFQVICAERPTFALSFTPEAEALKEEALVAAAHITTVESDEEEQLAVAAQAKLDGFLKAAEKSRKLAKEPAIEFGRKLDADVAAFVQELRSELVRVSKLIGNHVTLREQRQREAERVAREELSRIERERSAALAAAKTHDEVDAIQGQFNALAAAAEPPAPVPAARQEGQVIRHDWDVQITDIHALYRHHPNCVKLEPLVGEIKAILNGGGTVKGVKAERIVKAGVRQNRGAVLGV